MKYFVVGTMAACWTISISAEPPAPTPVQPVAANQPLTTAVLEPVAQQNILRAGTEVPLVTLEELSTKHEKPRAGQRFRMEVSSNVEVNGVVVIPTGTPATGEITEVRNKGMWGKSGYINARVLSLRMGDRTIRLSGTFDDKGVTGTAGVVGSVALVPLAGFFMTGTSAHIPTGSAVKAFLDEDIAFRTVAVPAQVIEIPVTVPSQATVSTAVSVPNSTAVPVTEAATSK